MKYYCLNKDFLDRTWVNKNENPSFLLDCPKTSIETYLSEHGYTIIDLPPDIKVVNFAESNPETITVTYKTYDLYKDYIIIETNDKTRFYYYPAPIPVEFYNKQFETIKVTYVLDEWATYCNTFTNDLYNANPTVLHRRKMTNRQKVNNEINLDIWEDIGTWSYKPTKANTTVTGNENDKYYECNITTHTGITELPIVITNNKINLALNISTLYENIYAYDENNTRNEYWGKYGDVSQNIIINIDLGTVEHPITNTEYWELPVRHFGKQIRSTHTGVSIKTNGLMDITNIDVENKTCTLQFLDIQLNVKGEFHTPNVFEGKFRYFSYDQTDNISIKALRHEDIPTPTPTSQRLLYIDYQNQPWYNCLPNDLTVELLPIEKKEYSHNDLYTYVANVSNYNWTLDISVKGRYSSATHNYKKLKIGIVDTHAVPTIKFYKAQDTQPQYTPVVKNYAICDGIFEKDKRYGYILCQASGMCYNNATEDKSFNLVNKNLWFLVPICNNAYDPDTTINNIWGINNFESTLKQIANIGSINAISNVFYLPIPPSLIGWANKDIVNRIFSSTTASTTYYTGLFNWQQYSDSTTPVLEFDNIGVIPVSEQALTIFLENNEFMLKTKNYLDRMNEFKTNLPTSIENEPVLYSPHCLNMCNLVQNNNNVVTFGNDFLNLKYDINNIGITFLPLANTTMSYCANKLTDTKMVSMTRNELSWTTDLVIPYNSNAYKNWENTHLTTESTSWTVFQNNADTARKTNILNNLGSLFRSIGSVSGGAISGNDSQMFSASGGFISTVLNSIANTMSMNNRIRNEELTLHSQFSNIKASSGTNVTMPQYSAGSFAYNNGLTLYTNFLRKDIVDDVGNEWRINGSPINRILPFINYENRQVFNVIAIDTRYNYNEIRNILKKTNTFFTKYSDKFINNYISNYLTGLRIWYTDYKNPIDVFDNYEINVFNDRDEI